MMNVSNSKESAYYGLTYSTSATASKPSKTSNSEGTGSNGDTISLDKNNSNSLFGVSSTYYTVVQGMTGFMGLINQNDSSSLDNSISERLFTNPTLDNANSVGLLHSFGDSKEDLIKTIESYTLSSEVNNLANQLKKYLPMIQFESVINISDNSLMSKKDALKNLINENYNGDIVNPGSKETKPITKEMFQQRKGYVGKTSTTSGGGAGAGGFKTQLANTQQNTNENLEVTDSPVSSTQSGAYVYQINTNDLKD